MALPLLDHGAEGTKNVTLIVSNGDALALAVMQTGSVKVQFTAVLWIDSCIWWLKSDR